MTNTKPLRIAQITDIHLTAGRGSELYGVDTARALEKVLDGIVNLSPIVELIIATGDLVEAGVKSNYARLRKFLRKTNLPVYVLPGNHDCLNEMHGSLAGDNIFYESAVAAGDWRFVFVNSRVAGKDYGCITPDELSLLEGNILASATQPVLVAIHHSPTPHCPSSDCQLVNATEFINLLKNYPNVKCVISGHVHKAVDENNQGFRQITTPATFAQVTHAQPGESVDHEDFWDSHKLNGDLHGFRTLDLYPDGKIETEVHWINGN